MTELSKRVAVAVPAAALMLWITWLGGAAFQILFGLIAIGTVYECHRILKLASMPGFLALSIALAFITWAVPYLTALEVGGIILLSLITIIFSLIFRKNTGFQRVLSSFFCGLYAPIGFLLIVEMRQLGDGVEGFWLVLGFFLMIWGNDVFAYFGGKKYGKRALAPSVSPNKTWEGFLFGFPGAAVGFGIAWLIAAPFPLSVWSIIPLVFIVSTAGPIGDLLESRLKRMADVKDSSSILPGHGGLFDRFDSMILSAPAVFFVCWILI